MSPGAPRRLLLLGSLYLSQGLPFGFFTQALPVLLRQEGLSLPAIGAASVLALPWMLKFLWAPLVDAAPAGALGLGRRRAWLIPLQALTALTMALLAGVDPTEALLLVALGTFVANLLAATQDVATDGLAVELLEPEERGLGNGLQVAAYRLGMILGGGLLLVVFDRLGWTPTFLAMSALLVAASVPVLLHRERTPPALPSAPARPLHELLLAIRRPGMTRWLGLLVAFKVGEALAGGMLRPFLVDQGLGLEEVGALLGLVGFTAGGAGALTGGLLVRRLGLARAVLAFGLLQSLAVALWALPALGVGGGALLVPASALEHFASGLATVSAFTAMMEACRREEGKSGTDYTLQASAFVAATMIGTVSSGFVAERLGYAGHFALAGLLSAWGAILAGTRLERALGRLASAQG